MLVSITLLAVKSNFVLYVLPVNTYIITNVLKYLHTKIIQVELTENFNNEEILTYARTNVPYHTTGTSCTG